MITFADPTHPTQPMDKPNPCLTLDWSMLGTFFGERGALIKYLNICL